MKLTIAQKETLLLIDNGEVYRANHGYAAWRINGANPQVVGRLIAMGLATWGQRNDTLNQYPCVLSLSGRTALAQGDYGNG